MSDHPKIAAVAGATGLIGRALTEALLASPAFDQVITFTRQAPGFEHPKLRAIELPDFNRIGEAVAQLETLIAEGFSALGTTIKTAGSQEAFRRVDCDFNSAFAAACEGAGARAFNLVSSVGADAHSSNFYLGWASLPRPCSHRSFSDLCGFTNPSRRARWRALWRKPPRPVTETEPSTSIITMR